VDIRPGITSSNTSGPRIHAIFRSRQHALFGGNSATFSSALQQFLLPQGTTGHQPSHQQHNEDHDRDEEQDTRDISRRGGYASEAEYRRHN
jgi:hypothetical protein